VQKNESTSNGACQRCPHFGHEIARWTSAWGSADAKCLTTASRTSAGSWSAVASSVSWRARTRHRSRSTCRRCAGAAPLDVRAVRRSGAARRYDTRGDLWQWRASSLPRAGVRAEYSGARPRGLPTRLTAYAASDSGLSSPLSESIASRFSFILRKARTVARRSASLI